MRHEELCVKCGSCRRICENDVAVSRLYDLERIGDCPVCIHCGQCANACPTNSITECSEYREVKKAILNPEKVVIFSTSPSVRVGLGEEFGLTPGAFVEGKMVASLRLIGAASGAGVIFGNTGGVMEAEARSAYFFVTGKNPGEDYLHLLPVRGMEGVRNAVIDIARTSFRVAVAHGINNAIRLVEEVVAGKCVYDFIEVMTCRGSCIGGGGQPKTEVPMVDDIRAARIAALYQKDDGMSLRFCHDNPDIKAVYEHYYQKPLSELAERLLHTAYHDRSSDLNYI